MVSLSFSHCKTAVHSAIRHAFNVKIQSNSHYHKYRNMLALSSLLGLMVAGDSICVSPKSAIVVDAETKARIRDAEIMADNKVAGKTIWDGSFHIPNSFAVMKIKKVGYLTRTLTPEEVTDTIVLLNNGRAIDEVVVWGKRPSMGLRFSPPKAYCRPGVTSGFGFDFFKTMDKIFNAKKYKRRKRAKRIIDSL